MEESRCRLARPSGQGRAPASLKRAAGAIPSSRRCEGFSLAELLAVVSILAILAVAAVPSARTNVPFELELAAREVADALEFARAESLRTGKVHGVKVDPGAERIVVYEANLAASPVGQTAVVYHPIDRKPWDRIFGAGSTTPIDVSNPTPPFDFPGDTARDDVLFDATGAPLWIVNPAGTRVQLGTGSVVLAYAGDTRSVTLSPITGRVSVQ